MTKYLEKGARINLANEVPGFKKLLLTCEWVNQAKAQHAELVAFCLNSANRVTSDQDVVIVQGKPVQGVTLLGDKQMASRRIEVALDNVGQSIERIAIVLFIAGPVSDASVLDDLGDIKVGLTEASTHTGFASFSLDSQASGTRCAILGEVYRKSGVWRFSVVGSGFAEGVEALTRLYGTSVIKFKLPSTNDVSPAPGPSSATVLSPASVPTPGSVAATPQTARQATSGVQSQAGEPLKCHKVDYELLGYEAQIVEIELDPGEVVVAEAGAMNYMNSGINYESKMGDGSNPKPGFLDSLLSMGSRLITGESLMMTHFTNTSSEKKRVAFAAPYPGTIIPLDMMAIGEDILCQKDAFLAAALGTEISLAFNRKIGSGFFGGEGFILQRIKGDGLAFIHAGGCVVEKQLTNDTLIVDTGCLVAFTKSIDYDIKMVKGLKSIFFGGEGLFLVTLTGSGTVWLQSAPFSRFADRVLAHAPSAGGSSQGEGSVLGGLGRLLDGD